MRLRTFSYLQRNRRLSDANLYAEDEQGEDLFGDANYEENDTVLNTENEKVAQRILRPSIKNVIVSS
jgi:ethanolamine ammonia-lyase large subunit